MARLFTEVTNSIFDWILGQIHGMEVMPDAVSVFKAYVRKVTGHRGKHSDNFFSTSHDAKRSPENFIHHYNIYVISTPLPSATPSVSLLTHHPRKLNISSTSLLHMYVYAHIIYRRHYLTAYFLVLWLL